jgi:hypothetical protein
LSILRLLDGSRDGTLMLMQIILAWRRREGFDPDVQ